ncbi:MAG: DNA gyrase inhibitor YacG [Methylomicrobium sp.]
MSTESAPLKVKCPVCGRSVEWTADYPFRPFCSERCKLIDLGAWAAEENRISEELPDSDETEDGFPYH